MTLNEYLVNILKASPPPTTLGLNIFPMLAPPGQQGRYSVFQVVASPPIYTQDGDPEGTRNWLIQFRQFSPSPFEVIVDTESIRDFLVGYRDLPASPGIQRVLETNTIDLPPSAQGRTYCRMVEFQITENLPA